MSIEKHFSMPDRGVAIHTEVENIQGFLESGKILCQSIDRYVGHLEAMNDLLINNEFRDKIVELMNIVRGHVSSTTNL